MQHVFRLMILSCGIVFGIGSWSSIGAWAEELEPIVLAAGELYEGRADVGRSVEFLLGPSEPEGTAYLRARVEQRGADVALELIDASGAQRFADQPLGFYQPELLLVPDGVYRLRVTARAPGAFGVIWNSVASGDARIPGDLAWTRGTDLYHRRIAEDRAPARDAFLRAAEAYESAGLRSEVARSLTVAGHLASDLSETESGLELLQRALQLRRAEGGHGLTDVLHLVGHVHQQRGEPEPARRFFEESLALSRSLTDPQGEAKALLNLGFLDHQTGHEDRASTTYAEALTVATRLGDLELQAKLLNNLAGLEFQAGRVGVALEDFETLLPLQRSLGNREAIARTLINMAVMRRALGRYQQALDAYHEALEVLESTGSIRMRASTLNNLGYTYLRLGDPEKARDYFLQSLPLRGQADDLRGEAVTLSNLGLSAQALHEPAVSASYFERALRLRRQVEDRRGEATTRHHFGRLQLERGELASAREHFDAAIALRREIGDQARAAQTLRHWVEVELAALDQRPIDRRPIDRRDQGPDQEKPAASSATARESLELALVPISEAITEHRRFGDPDGEAEALWIRAAVYRRLGDPVSALKDLTSAIEMAESLRLEVRSPDLRSTLMAVKRSIYEEAVDLLMVEAGLSAGPDGSRVGGSVVETVAIERPAIERPVIDRPAIIKPLEQAFAMAEQARARGLLDVLSGAGAPGLPANLRPEYRRRVETLAALEYQIQGRRRRGQPQLEQLEASRRQVSIEIDRQLRNAQSAQEQGLSSSTVLQIAELQQHLQLDDPTGNDATVMVTFSLGREQSWAFRVGKDQVAARKLPARDELDRRVSEVYSDLSTFDPRGSSSELRRARELSTLLFGSWLDELAGARLALVAEGSLLRLSFAALPLPGEHGRERLVDRFELAYLPSASSFPILRRLGRRQPAEQLLAVIADPMTVAESSTESSIAPTLARLPYSRQEAETLAELAAGRARLWMAEAAQRPAILAADLKDYRWLHFATHGYVDDVRPELSALALSRTGSGAGDGRLRLHDIYGMSLAADLVVLSGCETGLGKSVRGEGFLGLTRGFFFAGAARVAASLWRVEDRATAELMKRFYGNMLHRGQAPAQALREAQLALRRETRYKDPFYWAGFVVQGDWRMR